MTTTQEVTSGHRVSPPPLSVEHPAAPTGAGLPTDKANNDQNQLATDDPVVDRQKGVPVTPPLAQEKVPAGAYHFPPAHFSPRAHPYQHDDYLSYGKHPNPLPQRCQFMFSDGRQCTMARSDIHPSLCVYHSDREEQLFGDPTHDYDNRALDFPELHSACRDLSTARGVHRALAQVFRLLAQRRISRQEAATFAKLGQLLLQSISAMRAEGFSEPNQPMSPVVERQKIFSRESPRRERHGNQELRGATESHQELSRVNKVPITPLLPQNEFVPTETGAPDVRGLCARGGASEGPLSDAPENSSQPPSWVPAPRGVSFSCEEHKGSPENPIASESCLAKQSGHHESNCGQGVLSPPSDVEFRCAGNTQKPTHLQQNQHLPGTGFQLPYHQHLRNHGISSSSESTLAEKWEGSKSIAP